MAGAVEPGAPGGFFNIIPMSNKTYIVFLNLKMVMCQVGDSTTMKDFIQRPIQLSRDITNGCKIWRGKELYKRDGEWEWEWEWDCMVG